MVLNGESNTLGIIEKLVFDVSSAKMLEVVHNSSASRLRVSVYCMNY